MSGWANDGLTITTLCRIRTVKYDFDASTQSIWAVSCLSPQLKASSSPRLPGDVSGSPESRSVRRNVSISHLKFSEKERMGVGSEWGVISMLTINRG